MSGLGRCGYIHNGILLSHKKEQNNAILKYGQVIQSKNNKQTKHRNRACLEEQTWGSQGTKGREWDGWAFKGFFGWKLLYLKWIGSGALLYNTGKCVWIGHFIAP